jgi:hypothetical protein
VRAVLMHPGWSLTAVTALRTLLHAGCCWQCTEFSINAPTTILTSMLWMGALALKVLDWSQTRTEYYISAQLCHIGTPGVIGRLYSFAYLTTIYSHIPTAKAAACRHCKGCGMRVLDATGALVTAPCMHALKLVPNNRLPVFCDTHTAPPDVPYAMK